MSTTAPFLALKPTAVERGASAYMIPRNSYVPSPASISEALRMWLGPTNIRARHAEAEANRLGTNILGASFVVGLRQSGIEVCEVGTTHVENERESLTLCALYPDLETLDPARRSAIVLNNLGPFKVFSVTGATLTDTQSILDQLRVLKVTFREAVAECVARPPALVRDNLVHTPETLEELGLHWEVLRPYEAGAK